MLGVNYYGGLLIREVCFGWMISNVCKLRQIKGDRAYWVSWWLALLFEK